MNRERAATESTRSLARLEALAVRPGLSIGVLARDGFGRAYTRDQPRDEIALAMSELAGVDVGKVVADARERDALRRVERKRMWQASQ